MKIKDFDENLMSSKPIFNTELIVPGQVIEIYKVDAYARKDDALYHRTGIVEKVDHTMIKYSFFNHKEESMYSGFLYPGDILMRTPTDSQWEGKESLFLFKVLEMRQKVVYVDGME